MRRRVLAVFQVGLPARLPAGLPAGLRALLPVAFLLALVCVPASGQDAQGHVFRAIVRDAHSSSPLVGVNVSVAGTTLGAATEVDGSVTVTDIPAGPQTIVFSIVGFENHSIRLTFPLPDPTDVFTVLLEEAHEELEEIAVTATRTSRTIADLATRVETIAGEEIDEKISMEPANISMLLNESPGITVQQTSAVSGGASIRIQGLDGRYTQVLKDGFPLFGGFAGGLSLLQVPPLDLRQVEIIKGPSSTLYGGDAIAGLVNLVSRTPTDESSISLLANVTSAGGYDTGAFLSGRRNQLGLTLLATGNLQRPYDPDDDFFSNLPETRRFTLNPKLFYYPTQNATLSVGLAGTFEEREGGDMDVLDTGVTDSVSFVERNVSTRMSSQTRFDIRLREGAQILTLKNSVSVFDRTIDVPGYRFGGRQIASYTEASALLGLGSHDVVLGADVRTDAFREDKNFVDPLRDYTHTSVGVFAQDTWDASELLVLEAGLRAEYHNRFGYFALPRASVLVRLSSQLSARMSGGLGYKAPTVFLEPSEARTFRGVLPIDDNITAETSVGGGFDVNYRVLLFDRVALSLNQAFFFTNLDSPLVVELVGGSLGYRNAEGSIRTRAMETNVKFSLDDFKLFLGYVNLSARADHRFQRGRLPLTPRHKTYTVLVYEKHGTGRIGLEAYYTGPQFLPDGSRTEGYWITGVMAERKFGRARLFLNFENFLDTKQSNYAPVVIGPRAAPTFAEIWAPMDGFIVNGGVKYVLGG